MTVDLFLTPTPAGKTDLRNRTVVAIDVLRCSTSICAALVAGAKEVIPVPGPGEAGEMWSKIGGESAVLAGERDGVRIENFQLGNSPREFTPDAVAKKSVVMTTTNGTQIYSLAKGAALCVTGGLVNISAVARAVAGAGHDVVVVCGGQDGGFSIEDTICGGMLIHLLATDHKLEIATNDAGSLALLLYRTNKTSLSRTIAQGEHGRFLASIGFDDDVAIASDVDSMPVVPFLRDGRLTLPVVEQ